MRGRQTDQTDRRVEVVDGLKCIQNTDEWPPDEDCVKLVNWSNTSYDRKQQKIDGLSNRKHRAEWNDNFKNQVGEL